MKLSSSEPWSVQIASGRPMLAGYLLYTQIKCGIYSFPGCLINYLVPLKQDYNSIYYMFAIPQEHEIFI